LNINRFKWRAWLSLWFYASWPSKRALILKMVN